jgi:translation initiation factor RLI1
MPKPTAVVDYKICDPQKCCPEDGKCPAAAACEQKTMKQEGPFEPPIVFGLCKGCATCVTACPLKAIKIL